MGLPNPTPNPKPNPNRNPNPNPNPDQVGQGPLQPGVAYLWRVAAEHPDFGCGSFSPIVRLVLAEEETADGFAPRLV